MRKELGYVIAPHALPGGLKVRQFFKIYQNVRMVTGDPWEPLVELLQLGAFLETLISDCSLGTKQKICIASALIGSPGLVILDKSFNGLDTLAARRLREWLIGWGNENENCLLYASHMLDQLRTLCDRILIVTKSGKIVDSALDPVTLKEASVDALEAKFLSLMSA